MIWSEGKKWSNPGFVVEDALIDTWIEWDKEQQRYDTKEVIALNGGKIEQD